MKLWLEKSFFKASPPEEVYEIWMWPERNDNYGYLIKLGSKALVIDPSTNHILKVVEHLKIKSLDVALTHHHFDHISGLKYLQSFNPQVHCSSYDLGRIALATKSYESESFNWEALEFEVPSLKGHTQGHVALYNKEFHFIFSGDVIFSLGCGRLFEGSPQELKKSLSYFLRLPEETSIFASHEYTLKNFEFLVQQKGPHPELRRQLETRLKKEGKTLPTTLGFEKKHNPFLNCLTQNLTPEAALSELTQLREKRDLF